jgi:hypothetical protein
VTGGAISSISVVLSGYGYSAAPTVQITDPTGTGATATASISGGGVSGITVTAGGSGYSSTPTVTLTGPAVGQSDIGSCTLPSTTQVTVTSTNAKANWPANYWDYSPTGHQGVIVLRSDTITGYTQLFTARIIANTALSPGGTSTLTIDSPAPATTYNSYQIYGTAGGASFVYRRYQVTNAAIAAQMTNYFPYPVAYRNSDGTSATLTSTPAGTVFYSPSGSPPYEQSSIGVECDAESGTILTSRPTALVFSADGVTPTPVDDFQAFVPVNTGALDVRYPTSGYQGTAYTALGIQRTKVITCLDWKDSSNSLNMTLFASEYLATVQDIVYEGSLPYFGLLANALLIGQKLNIAGSTYPTGWDSFAIPIIAVDLEYRERSGATSYLTTLSISNRRAPFSGAALKRPAVLGQPFGIGLTGLPSAPQPTGPSAAGQGSPAGAASDQSGAMDSKSPDSPTPVAALGGDPAPSDSLARSLPEVSQTSLTDPASLSSGAASSPQTRRADEPADGEGRQGRGQRFVNGRTAQFVRKPPSFRPRLADTFARSYSRPDVYSVSVSGDDADPVTWTDQDYGTQTIQANPSTSYSQRTADDQSADTVAEPFDAARDDAERVLLKEQDDDTKATEANLTGRSDEGTPNDQRADPVAGTLDVTGDAAEPVQRADPVAGTLDVGMRGSADTGPAAPGQKGPDNRSGRFRLFGQNFVAPWASNAAGVGATLSAYGRTARVAASGAAAGAAGGAVTGAATGAVIGGVGGALAGLGVASVPAGLAGAGAGAQTGLVIGAGSGALSGLISAAFADVALDAAKKGVVSGAITGVAAPIGGGVGGAVAARITAPGGSAIVAGAGGGVAGSAAASGIGQTVAIATGQQDGYRAKQFAIDMTIGTILGGRSGAKATAETEVGVNAGERAAPQTQIRVQGIGGNGAASELRSLNGLSRTQATQAIERAGFRPTQPNPTPGGWQTFRHADGSQVDIGPGGRVVRTAAPRYGPDGSRINRGQRLASDGSEIPRSLPHDQHPPETFSDM